ncbi:hypothetical protein Trco_007163 [Trichoderma cornu-damae]|uniref:Chitinase n=1 Tax=Trichoderma cornu-damae TaxID=654480 RepID=A0A9P8QG59_9HYPO|nr:hypothetical protein Trco_007163 [Trichoderma cornu-damae]
MHIHFAFTNVAETFDIDVSGAQDQFDRFKFMPSTVKKIISLGGWDFGTKPGTLNILRGAIKAAKQSYFQKITIIRFSQNRLTLMMLILTGNIPA